MLLHCHGKFRFYHWLSVSLVLHSGIILPFVLISFHRPASHKCSKLQIELFGMIADRQMEEKHAAPRPRPPQHVSRPRQSPDTYKTVATESPVQVKKAEDKPKPTEQNVQPMPVSPVPLPAVSNAAGTDMVQQRQQTIMSAAEQEADEIRKYLARLAKTVRTNLAYPEEVRKHGIEGVSTIAFTVTKSGDIKGDSLRVKKSSGYAALDSSALRSARVSAPFEKPPKELNVSIAVSFTIEMAKSRAKQAPVL